MERILPTVFALEPLRIEQEVDTIKHGIAYSGGVISTLDEAGVPIDIIFDLSSLSLEDDRYPLLYAHDDKAWVGSFRLINDKSKLQMQDFKMLDNQYSAIVIDALKREFPAKNSVRIMPKQVDFVGENSETTINGIPVKNVFVYRDSTISEVSVTSIPRDRHTPLSLFADTQNKFHPFNVRSVMTDKVKENAISPQEFAEQQKIIADLQAQLATQNKIVTKFSNELESQKAETAKLLAERDKFAEESAQLALQIRTAGIADLESMFGEFSEDEKAWLMNMPEPDFQMFAEIMKNKAVKGSEPEEMSAELESPPAQMSESDYQKAMLLSPHLFSNQARNGKSPVSEEDTILAWAKERNGVRQ